ncbi:hypothetical protein [Thermococcus thioreducens]|uniref:Uncharacterized protein n=1 Tax=Thermococcus thioreducens TaxID=277988 RepID=A0A0Q2QTU0_9EURY|nr:hypothetical protein [Thermococcus thioreducens]ASJ11410.1 hypothetical protein A3L14_00255 [Thermococcus thioreducens]KQH83429.1 hypothetical protein AMR53_00260 [Thermococcus thioreducens]SEW07207.1 hypothetical protein SAMN05216170_1388 [Thermococcus thioreducens]
MKRVRLGVVLLLVLSVAMAGCLDNNFVYARGKSVPPGESRGWFFKGPANLTVKVTSNIPVEVEVVSSGGTVLKDFGTVREVNAVVELPKGRWKVVVRNPGNETAVIDVTIKA